MLYALLEWLNNTFGDIPGLGVVKYISFRSAMAIFFSLIISVYIGKKIINLLRKKLIGESIRKEGPESHKSKAGTPTMGGLIIMAAILIPTLLWGDLSNAYVVLICVATLWMGIIGFVDDYIKVFRKNKGGLKGKFKIVGQVGLGLIVGITMAFHPDFSGPKGRVAKDGTIMVNDFLAEKGFVPGDKILSVENTGWSIDTTFGPASTFIVARGEYDHLGHSHQSEERINIRDEDKMGVHEALFGKRFKGFQTKTNVPFLKGYAFDYSKIAFWEEEDGGIWGKIIYILIVIFIVTAVSNGVNLTDGLDGLAAGTSAIAAATLAVFAWVSGNVIFSEYLNIYYIPMSAELVIFCAALVGACVGFLWYNTHPAQVFMGDTGSLMLGGAIGVLAMMIKKELLLPLICGVFFVESLSVILQVTWFKYTKKRYGEGRRILKMAPLHHHYELKGLHEAKITARFWIVAAMLCVLAFVTLKLR